MVSKYYKTGQKSLRNNSFKSFQLYIYIYEHLIFMLVNVFNDVFTTFENIPPFMREVVVYGNRNYFYRAVAF